MFRVWLFLVVFCYGCGVVVIAVAAAHGKTSEENYQGVFASFWPLAY